MDLKLNGKRALVTGSTSGIGLEIAKTLLLEGCEVIVNGRDKKKGEEAAGGLGEGCTFIAADMTNEVEVRLLARLILEKLGGLDILVCNVGSGESVALGEEDSEEWNRVFGINLYGAINALKATQNLLSEAKGAVVCISSICGSRIFGAPITYSVAKAALNHFVINYSSYLAGHSVRINAVAPGNIYFAGSVWQKKMRSNADFVEKMLRESVPLGRFGTTQEIADLVAFLVSERSSFTTGQIFTVDGGQSVK